MKLSFNNNRVVIILILIILTAVSCAAQTPPKQEAARTINPGGDFKTLRVLLTPKTDSASNDLIKQWHKKVEEITRYTVEDHIALVESLQKEQVELLKQLDQCSAQATAATRNYSSQWLIDLKNKFGLEYLKENRDDFFVCLGAVVGLPTDHYCHTTQEKMTFNEDALAMAYKQYCYLFNTFYDNLQNDQKSLLADQHKQVQKLLESVERMPNIVVGYETISAKLAEQRAMRSNKALYLYMKNDLNMMTINIFKAGDDFRSLIGE